MGTSSRKKTKQRVSSILGSYFDGSSEINSKESIKSLSKELTNSYIGSNKSATKFLDSKKLGSIISIGISKIGILEKDYLDENSEIILEKRTFERVLNELIEEDSELQEESDIILSAFRGAMATAILEENKEESFIKELIINTIKLATFSDVKEAIIEKHGDTYPLNELKKEIENYTKTIVDTHFSSIISDLRDGNEKVLAKAIKHVKKVIKGEN